MSIKHEKSGNSGNTSVNRYVFCHEHTPANAQPKGVSMASWKRSIDEKIKKTRKQIQNSGREAPRISIPVIPLQKVAEIKEAIKIDKIEDICYYWALKRQSRCGVPLIRRLQVWIFIFVYTKMITHF